MAPSKVIPAPDSDVYHEVRGGRVKHGGTGISYSRDETMSVEEANRAGLRPCGLCWRSQTRRDRIASIGIEEDDDG